METVERDGVDLAVERAGEGELVVFVGDAGLGAWTLGWQFDAVAGPFEAVAFDHRGTGRSDAPPGPYRLADLVADLRAVVRACDAGKPHLVGLGVGGLVALRYALDERVQSLTLLGTAASGAAFDRAAYASALADPADPDALRTSLSALLSDSFREHHPDVLDQIVAWRADDDAGERAQTAQLGAVEGVDLAERRHEITAPALVVHGGADRLVDRAAGERLARGLPRGEFHAYPDAGHLVGVERSRPVNDDLVAFLEGGA